jgi:hypothetical protein
MTDPVSQLPRPGHGQLRGAFTKAQRAHYFGTG